MMSQEQALNAPNFARREKITATKPISRHWWQVCVFLQDGVDLKMSGSVCLCFRGIHTLCSLLFSLNGSNVLAAALAGRHLLQHCDAGVSQQHQYAELSAVHSPARHCISA